MVSKKAKIMPNSITIKIKKDNKQKTILSIK